MSVDTSRQIPLSGLVPAGEEFYRKIYLEMDCDKIPKDPNVQVRVQVGEIAPGCRTDWHLHHGPAFFLVLEGEVVIEHQGQEAPLRHTAGDAFMEPVGIIHRASNPDPVNTLSTIGFYITPPDRPVITSVYPPPPFIQEIIDAEAT